MEFEFRQDEYHRHAATSIAETLGFHLSAFANPQLNNTPETWSFVFTPDVRYGTELLYQAFQRHMGHLPSWKQRVP